MGIGVGGAVKLWLLIKPIRRIKAFRNKEAKEVGLVKEIGLGAVRHLLTGLGLVFANTGLATGDEVQAAVAALVTLVGFGWSVYRKWRRV